jgi:hypothetical protein
MKRIKLFENFNELDHKEIVADIETIIYELEEKEYDVEISYETELVDGRVNAKMFNGLSRNRIVISPVYKKGPRTPFSDLLNNTSNVLDDFRNDMNIFINQLRDHLDYIDPDKITLKEKVNVRSKYAFEIRIDLRPVYKGTK